MTTAAAANTIQFLITNLNATEENVAKQVWIPVLTVSFAVMTGLVGCFRYLCQRRRKEQSSKDTTTCSSDLSSTTGSLEILTKLWDPTEPSSSRATLQRSTPLQRDDILDYTSHVAERSSDPIPLYEESRGFISRHFVGDDDTEDTTDLSDEDEEDDEPSCPPNYGTWTHVDLVGQGVFPRTLETLKTRPRCVLCSVGFEVGDTVTVSPACLHGFHEECLRSYWQHQQTTKSKSKSSSTCTGIAKCCPVCRIEYIV